MKQMGKAACPPDSMEHERADVSPMRSPLIRNRCVQQKRSSKERTGVARSTLLVSLPGCRDSGARNAGVPPTCTHEY